MVSNTIWQEPNIEQHVTLLVESYERICKKAFPIPLTSTSLAFDVYHTTDFTVVSHGLEKDPIFNFANLAAQKLWKMDWNEFTSLPSRYSAKADKVEKREALLQEALTKGYIDNYEGIRIDKTGKEFSIAGVTLWRDRKSVV